MKLSVIIGIVLILAVTIAYTLRRPDTATPGEMESQMVDSDLLIEGARSSGDGSTRETAAKRLEANQEKRREKMQVAFSALLQLRKQLKSYVNLLKSKTWGLELPAREAGNVTNKLRQAYAYLKNPAMQGAYFELEEIQSEIRKVEAMLLDLNEVEALIALSQRRED